MMGSELAARRLPMMGTFIIAALLARAAAEEVAVAIVGAGYAGLSAALALAEGGVDDFRVFEATDHVGGRTRNCDAKTLRMDTANDDVLEVGGTFVAPGHTALIDLAARLGFPVYNVSGSRRGLREPSKTWPWWWFGVDQCLAAVTIFERC
jgi:hypothetical protein